MMNFALLSFCISSIAFAKGGGSSIGPSICSYGDYTCTSEDQVTTACAFQDKIGLFFEMANGGSLGLFYKVDRAAQPNGIEYRGNEALLLVDMGTQIDGKYPAKLTYSPAGYYGYELQCTKNAH
jgi:hypothetical protein